MGKQPSQPTVVATRSIQVIAATSLIVAAVFLLLAAGLRHASAAPLTLSDGGQYNGRTSQTLPTTRNDFFLPGTQPHTLQSQIPFSTSCDACHTAPIYDAWRGSMMSQAARDPVFYAALEVANKDAANAGDYCLRCHTPGGWLEGRSEPADGSALIEKDLSDGVACEVCHRMVDPVPGAMDELADVDIMIRAALTSTVPTDHAGNAMLIVDPLDRRRGPFDVSPPHSAYKAEFQSQDSDAETASRLCGSCHNVDNPLLSWEENPPGGGPAQYWPNEVDAAAPSFGNGDIFPLERTYDEWLNSAFADGGVYAPQFAGFKQGGVVESCQDCHMERQTGFAADLGNAIERDCLTTGCLPAHTLVGGNAWVPQILQDTRWRLNSAEDGDLLDATTARAESMLGRAAHLFVTLDQAGANPTATVQVVNKTGHKLPTGYPEGRRIWIHLQAFDASDALVFESGAYDASTGTLIPDETAKVYEAKQGLTPELAAFVGKTPGETFHFALNNTVEKDNRIPPQGFTTAAFDQPGLRPIGATYVDGQNWDDTVYQLPATVVRVVASLYYQTSSGEYIEFLRDNGGADAQVLYQLWEDNKSPPVLMAQRAVPSVGDSFMPVVSR